MTNRATVINFNQLAKQEKKNVEKALMKQTRLLFSNYDLLSDKERKQSLHVFTDEGIIKGNPELAIFS